MTGPTATPPIDEDLLRTRLGELAAILTADPVADAADEVLAGGHHGPHPDGRRPDGRRRPGLLVAAAVLVVVIGCVAWAARSGTDDATQVATEDGTAATDPPATTTSSTIVLATTEPVLPGPDRAPGPNRLNDVLTARFPDWFAGLHLDPATQTLILLHDVDGPAAPPEEIDALAAENGYGPDQYILEEATWTRAELMAVEDELLAAFPDGRIPGTDGTITAFGVAADRGYVEIGVDGVSVARAAEILAERLPRDLISVVEHGVNQATPSPPP